MRIKEQPFSKNDVYSESVCIINGQQYKRIYAYNDVIIGNNTNNHPDNLQMVPRGINSSFFFINRCKPREFRETPQNCGQS